MLQPARHLQPARLNVRALAQMAAPAPNSPAERKELRLLAHVTATAPRGDADAVLKAMDAYSWESEWFMAVGDVKGAIVQQAITSMATPPKRVLELGTYCGYGAIRIAITLPDDGKVYTVDPDTFHLSVARQIIEHAGLSHKIRVLEGTLESVLPVIQSEHSPLDFVFIDHVKHMYVPDLKLLMATPGLLHPGTVVAADNIWIPGAPDYVAYMDSEEGKAAWDTTLYPTLLEYQREKEDAVAVSVYKGGGAHRRS